MPRDCSDRRSSSRDRRDIAPHEDHQFVLAVQLDQPGDIRPEGDAPTARAIQAFTVQEHHAFAIRPLNFKLEGFAAQPVRNLELLAIPTAELALGRPPLVVGYADPDVLEVGRHRRRHSPPVQRGAFDLAAVEQQGFSLARVGGPQVDPLWAALPSARSGWAGTPACPSRSVRSSRRGAGKAA